MHRSPEWVVKFPFMGWEAEHAQGRVVDKALDICGERSQSSRHFAGFNRRALRGGSQCPWIGSLESLSASVVTIWMARATVRACVVPHSSRVIWERACPAAHGGRNRLQLSTPEGSLTMRGTPWERIAVWD